MAFDWKALVELAHDLEQQAKRTDRPEALCRTVLNRAYFGAFCHARNFARDYLGYRPLHTADDHGRIRNRFRQSKRARVATSLDRLRQWRNDSDYLDELSYELQPVVASALREAERVFQLLT